jgi:hypothetical protein
MKVGDLVKHRVMDMIGIILRTPKAGDRWKVVRWNNGVEFSERTINLVLLCK